MFTFELEQREHFRGGTASSDGGTAGVLLVGWPLARCNERACAHIDIVIS